MVALAATDLITVWERAWSASPTEQALALLLATNQAESPETLAALPIGTRDRRLIRIRERLFGDQLALLMNCPECDTQVELELSTRQIIFEDSGLPNITHSLSHGKFEIRFRVPNSQDMIAISRAPNIEHRRRLLLQRCVESACRDEKRLELDEIPDSTVREIVQAMDAADPQANIEIPMRCVDCEHQWNALFDIVTNLWTEIDAWAQKTLNEIHLIASAYGWNESTILNLPPSRRQLYVSMVRQ